MNDDAEFFVRDEIQLILSFLSQGQGRQERGVLVLVFISHTFK